MTPTTTPTLTRSLVKTSLYILRAKAMQRKVSRIWRTCFLLFVDSGYRIPDTGYRIPDSGFRIPDSGFLFRIPVSGFWGCLKWSWKAPGGVSNYVQCSNVPICSNKSSLENSFASQIDIWCGGMAQAPPSGTLWPQNSSLCNSLQGFFT